MWSLLEKGGQQIASFLLFLVVARLLGPEEYGLAMLAFVYLSLAHMLLVDMAESVVTLQLKDDERLSTLFWMIFLVGLGFSTICYFTAEPFAAFLEEPRLVPLLQWLAPVPLLIGLMTVPNMLIMQQMNFKVYAIRSLIATVGSGVVGVTLAYYGYGALAIVIQQIVLYAIINLIIWLFVDWRPSLKINTGYLKEVVAPGLNMMGSNSLNFLEQQVPRVILGQFLGPVSVGYYSFAFRMRFALQEILIVPTLISLFPALSQIQGDEALQHRILEKIFFLVGLVIFPAIIVAAITAPLYVPLLFGEKWHGVTPLLQLFLFLGVVAPFESTITIIFRSYNKLNAFVRIKLLTVALGLLAVYIGAQFNLITVGWIIFVYTVLRIPLYFAVLKRSVGMAMAPHILGMLKSAIATALMSGAVFLYIFHAPLGGRWADLLISLVLASSTYLLLTLLLQKDQFLSLILSMKEQFRKRSPQ